MQNESVPRTAFYQNVTSIIEAIEDCYAKRRHVACLILLYSGIDSIAALEAGSATPETFKTWVASYLLKAGTFACTPTDLYAARCGILHTFSADSNLSKAGRARIVAYAFEKADIADIEKAYKPQNCVAVHLGELVDAFRVALGNYMEQVLNEPNRLQKVEESCKNWMLRIDLPR